MTFDFGSLKVPGKGTNEIEPRALLRSLPVREGAINDLWDGQAQALTAWHKTREASDNLVILNTGAGKTIVGLLIAESLRRETRGNIVYLCPTNDLVAQVAKEASKLGLEHTVRAGSNWTNDLYERGRAICITNYQALLNSRTVFRGEKAASAIIFDDAHVAESVIRDQFTLRISPSDHENTYNALIAMILAHERDASYNTKLAQVLAGASIFGTMLVSPIFGRDRHAELNALIQPLVRSEDARVSFPLGHLYGKWEFCAFCVSKGSIEISPPALPTLSYGLFQDPAIRRVYLSATLGQAVDFARSFGKDIKHITKPDVDAGNGERLILFSEQLGGEAIEVPLGEGLAKFDKILIAVPNTKTADRWGDLGKPSTADRFTRDLDAFRQSKGTGAFVLLGRYDGIDLPQETCRLMALDSVPRGASLLERYCWEYLNLQSELRSRIATRITQLFGRIIRGRVDYGCFILMSRELNVWLSDDRNLALLPDLLASQIKLGLNLHEQLNVKSPDRAVELVKQVLSREDGWVRFYREYVSSTDIEEDVKAKSAEQQETIKEAALRWVQYWSAIWGNEAADRVAGLRDALEGVLPKLAAVDSRGAGWLDMWLGTRYAAAGEEAFAADHFGRARSRLLAELPLPRTQVDRGGLAERDISALGNRFLDTFRGGIIQANNRIARDDSALHSLTGAECSTNEYEEALKFLGDRLGFVSSRPDNEEGTGPDVLWRCDLTKVLLPLEAKTEKLGDAYNKQDIGQALQHAEWVKEKFPEFQSLGVVIIGRPTKVTEEASPSDEIYYASADDIARAVAGFKDLRNSVARDLGASRLAQVAKLGIDDEWTLKAVFDRLGPKQFN